MCLKHLNTSAPDQDHAKHMAYPNTASLLLGCRTQPTAVTTSLAWGETPSMVARVAVSLLTDREVSRSSQMPAVCQSQALLSLFTDYGSKQAQHLASAASCMQLGQ